MDYKIGSLLSLISGTNSSEVDGLATGSIKFVKVKPKENFKKRKSALKKEDLVQGRKRKKDKNSSLNYNLKTDTSKHINLQDAGPVSISDAVGSRVSDNLTNAAKRVEAKQKKVAAAAHFDEEKESRTVFVGNVPNSMNKMKLKKLFEKFGNVQSVRFRCAPLADPRVPKKIAVIKGQFHADRSNIHAFVCFAELESAQKALALNGVVVEDHHLRVDSALAGRQHDNNRAVFVGNVPFAAEEDALWKVFEDCGKITSIRIIRDKSGVGKGFAYVNFENSDAVELAVALNGEKLNDRELRVSRAVKKVRYKPFEANSKRPTSKNRKKTFEQNVSQENTTHKKKKHSQVENYQHSSLTNTQSAKTKNHKLKFNSNEGSSVGQINLMNLPMQNKKIRFDIDEEIPVGKQKSGVNFQGKIVSRDKKRKKKRISKAERKKNTLQEILTKNKK